MEPRARGPSAPGSADRRFHIQKNGKAITVKHDVTGGVTNAVTESVTATPAVTVDHRVTAGVTEAVTDTVTRVALVWQ
jgi:hypothetical protein